MLYVDFSVFTRKPADEPVCRMRSKIKPLFKKKKKKKSGDKIPVTTKWEEKNKLQTRLTLSLYVFNVTKALVAHKLRKIWLALASKYDPLEITVST